MPPFLDKEGNEISEYEAKRLERIAKNEAYLERLGLSNLKKEIKAHKRKKASPPRKHKSTKRTRRQSSRLKKDSSSLIMLSYRDEDETTCIVQQANEPEENGDGETFGVSPKPYRGRKYSTIRREDWELTTEQKKALEQNMDDNYLSKFKEFLVFHNKISEQNVRNVMRQVTKLARGEGVRYESPRYGWPEDCYFLKGTKVTPLSDIPQIMVQAQDAEDTWGRDHGNGWLLSHPLKKLLLFQQFALLHPDFLTSKCKLKEYYEEIGVEE